jgi:nucleolar GTP-binding protein
MDYKYLRWQVVDTPGVLDHPLEEMNTIEMQSITALAHIRAAVLYFMDLSEQCGYTIEAQCKLFHSIKPLFANKPVVLVINKIDIVRLADLTPENRAYIQTIIDDDSVLVVEASTYSEEGLMEVRNKACELLLAHRVEQKLRGNRIEAVANKIHVAVPQKRDDVERTPFIPDAVKSRVKYDAEDPNRRKLEKDTEQEMGTNPWLGIYTQDLRRDWQLADDSWKYDIQPELYNGKNVADFIDPDIMEKLEALEREEEQLEAQGFYASEEEEMLDSDEEEFLDAADQVRSRKAEIKKISQDKRKQQNKPVIPRKKRHVTLDEFTHGMRKVGHDPITLEKRASRLMEGKKAAWEASEAERIEAGGSDGGMEVDGDAAMEDDQPVDTSRRARRAAAKSKGSALPAGLASQGQLTKAKELRMFAQREPNRHARASESDRHIPITRPKWMLAGKRKGGTTDRR